MRLKPQVAQILTSMIVCKFWSPVGSPVRGNADAPRVCGYVFGDEAGARRLGQVDSAIARLPGVGLVRHGIVDSYEEERDYSHLAYYQGMTIGGRASRERR
jgi:hypothetical protein